MRFVGVGIEVSAQPHGRFAQEFRAAEHRRPYRVTIGRAKVIVACNNTVLRRQPGRFAQDVRAAQQRRPYRVTIGRAKVLLRPN